MKGSFEAFAAEQSLLAQQAWGRSIMLVSVADDPCPMGFLAPEGQPRRGSASETHDLKVFINFLIIMLNA